MRSSPKFQKSYDQAELFLEWQRQDQNQEDDQNSMIGQITIISHDDFVEELGESILIYDSDYYK